MLFQTTRNSENIFAKLFCRLLKASMVESTLTMFCCILLNCCITHNGTFCFFYFQTPNLNPLNAPQVGSGNVGRPAMPVLPLPLPAKGLPQPLPVGVGHAGMPQVNPMPSKPPGHYPPPPGMLAIKLLNKNGLLATDITLKAN